MTDSAPPGNAPTGNGDRRSGWERDDEGAPARAASSGGRHRTLNRVGHDAGAYLRPSEPARRAVTSVPGSDAPTAAFAAVAPRRTTIHVSDVLLPVSIALWAIGVSRTNTTKLERFGLPAQLPVIFCAGCRSSRPVSCDRAHYRGIHHGGGCPCTQSG